jgi:hypothetical protein
MEEIGWTDGVKNEALRRVKEDRDLPQTIKRRKAKWIAHVWRRHCFLKHIIEGNTEGRIDVTGRRRRRRKQLLGAREEKRILKI